MTSSTDTFNATAEHLLRENLAEARNRHDAAKQSLRDARSELDDFLIRTHLTCKAGDMIEFKAGYGAQQNAWRRGIIKQIEVYSIGGVRLLDGIEFDDGAARFEIWVNPLKRDGTPSKNEVKIGPYSGDWREIFEGESS